MKTTDKAVSFLSKAIKELERVVKTNVEEEERCAFQIAYLEVSKHQVKSEADRAARIKAKLEELVA